MTVSLSKGGSVSLTKEAGASTLSSLTVGLGWDKSQGFAHDLDLSAVLAGSSGKVASETDLVFYGAVTHVSGSVRHGGDNRTGEGDGDDERIVVDLTTVPASVHSIVFIASIDKAIERGQSFGSVTAAYIRVVNNADNRELARFDLTDGASSDIALSFGEVYRDGGDWKFQAIGDGYSTGLAGVLGAYGIDAA
ncbi:tellurium resistance protein TerD [Salinibacterium xinjiangense]|uniref:Tellurium resistance protein TerD n=1 Tax=Salinibacterium xinjiangense TaxID=386302 RepID=A0A2C8YT76_9MICO|nr:TerD family protein [Salinibacterium xinjiangense]GGK99821.1 tellurium resistance protein TerD [Salinibacterium xinjiangense]SOE53896.1 tellurium resistance protein TerD [Salinibacterium xinjiangense]